MSRVSWWGRAHENFMRKRAVRRAVGVATSTALIAGMGLTSAMPAMAASYHAPAGSRGWLSRLRR